MWSTEIHLLEHCFNANTELKCDLVSLPELAWSIVLIMYDKQAS